jgi:hypothetical protein
VGSDIAAGELVLAKGSLIGAAEVGLLATVGAAEIEVLSRPFSHASSRAICREGVFCLSITSMPFPDPTGLLKPATS